MVVTGGAGFIGANFVRLALEETDARIVVVDKLTYAGRMENLEGVASNPRFLFRHADIADGNAIRQLYDELEPLQVLNFAAETHVDRSIDDPSTFLRTNIRGAFELLQGALSFLGRQSEDFRRQFRFLHVSTDEVFGSLGDTGRFTETTPYAPNSPYAASKAAADHLVRAYHRTYGLPTLITNASNNYGPFQLPEKLIPLMILRALDGQDLPIYGDGSNVRDWIYVGDHCAGLLRVLQEGVPGESYNLGADCERTNLEIVEAICTILEEERPARDNEALRTRSLSSYRDLRKFVQDRPGHDQRYAIDATRVRQELGWKPNNDFESGLRETVRWFLDNQAWADAAKAEGATERIGLSVAGP
jgi:dTDP-glucose 4,6-dehydratase